MKKNYSDKVAPSYKGYVWEEAAELQTKVDAWVDGILEAGESHTPLALQIALAKKLGQLVGRVDAVDIEVYEEMFFIQQLITEGVVGWTEKGNEEEVEAELQKFKADSMTVFQLGNKYIGDIEDGEGLAVLNLVTFRRILSEVLGHAVVNLALVCHERQTETPLSLEAWFNAHMTDVITDLDRIKDEVLAGQHRSEEGDE